MQDLDRELERARKKLVLVEGVKDKRALEALGFSHVVPLKNRPLFEIIESVEEREVLILTDLDPEGRKLFSSLSRGLKKRGVKVDNKLRLALMKAGLSHIEGLATFLKNQKRI